MFADSLPPLFLASSSPYRKELLSRLNIPFQALKPPYDEETAKATAPSDPIQFAATLAKGKAKSLMSTLFNPTDGLELPVDSAVIIGGDQLLAFENLILGKSHNYEKAFLQLKSLQGKSHDLITATSLVVVPSKALKKESQIVAQEMSWVEVTKMHMRPLNDQQIDIYLRQDEPYDCAGSYKIESGGIRLFEKIECPDWTTIQGLPLIRLTQELIKLGYLL